MEKYYRTLRTSATGQKLQAIQDKGVEANAAKERLREKYGWENTYASNEYIYGDISGVTFPTGTEVDMQMWKPDKSIAYNAYSPRRGHKKGKAIYEEFRAVPRATRYDIDKIVGHHQAFNHVGYTMENDTYFGFAVNAGWRVEVPADCEEITASQYEELCKKSE